MEKLLHSGMNWCKAAVPRWHGSAKWREPNVAIAPNLGFSSKGRSAICNDHSKENSSLIPLLSYTTASGNLYSLDKYI